ncbi:MAG: biotin/lipoate A/B protein ligase family protein [Nitrospirota bacterium]
MALDEAISGAVKSGSAPPTLRLYGWSRPSVSIGFFQRISDLDLDYCLSKKIPVVRRTTGGRAILHDDEITYSFAAKTASGIFSKGLVNSYDRISQAFSLALIKAGFMPESRQKEYNPSAPDYRRSPLCFKSLSYAEITLNNVKIMGSAQKRWADVLLQQGTLPLAVNKEEVVRVFKLDNVRRINDSMLGLRDLAPELDVKEFKHSIRAAFEETFGARLETSSPSTDELIVAEEFKNLKYASDEWNFGR